MGLRQVKRGKLGLVWLGLVPTDQPGRTMGSRSTARQFPTLLPRSPVTIKGGWMRASTTDPDIKPGINRLKYYSKLRMPHYQLLDFVLFLLYVRRTFLSGFLRQV